MTHRAALSFCLLMALTAVTRQAFATEQSAPTIRERAVAALLDTRPTFNAAGVGLYPFKLEFEAHGLSVTSHVAAGANANLVRARTGADLDPTLKVVGAVAQARLAVGAKLQITRSFAASAEVGYAPWAVDLVVRSSAPSPSASVVDLSFGIDWR
jgi:hypothetical protein